MTLDKPHDFGLDGALARVKALCEYWAKNYGVKTDWNGSVARIDGKVKGVKFKGNIGVEDKRVYADIKAGFLAEKLGGRKYVEDKLADYLDPANSLESLEARV